MKHQEPKSVDNRLTSGNACLSSSDFDREDRIVWRAEVQAHPEPRQPEQKPVEKPEKAR